MKKPQGETRKWVRQKQAQKSKAPAKKELGKKQLVEVLISEGRHEDFLGGAKKRRQDVVMEDASASSLEVVLENQHRLAQRKSLVGIVGGWGISVQFEPCQGSFCWRTPM